MPAPTAGATVPSGPVCQHVTAGSVLDRGRLTWEANLTPSQTIENRNTNSSCAYAAIANDADVATFAIPVSAELELALADFEGLDFGFERGCRNAKIRRRA